MSEKPPKRPIFKSFGDLPSMPQPSRRAVPNKNKIGTLTEDQFSLGSRVYVDEDYGLRRPVMPVQTQERPIYKSPEAASLERRIEILRNDKYEDPAIKAHLLKNLEERLAAVRKKDAAVKVAPKRHEGTLLGQKKTGWWDAGFRNEQLQKKDASAPQKTIAASAHSMGSSVSEPVLQTDVKRMSDQMDRLDEKRKQMRKNTGVTDKEALATNPDYKAIKSEIGRIRFRLQKIEAHKGTPKYEEEIKKLRSELAKHLLSFRHVDPTRPGYVSEAEEEPIEHSFPYDHLSPEEKIDAQNWEGLSAALMKTPVRQEADVSGAPVLKAEAPKVTQTAQKEDKEEEKKIEPEQIEKAEEDRTQSPFVAPINVPVSQAGYGQLDVELPKPETEPESSETPGTYSVRPEAKYGTIDLDLSKAEVPQTPEVVSNKGAEPTSPHIEQKAWEKRAELKREWRSKKEDYDTAYKTYLEDRAKDRENQSALRKIQFWRKDKQPPELLKMEEEYLNASSAYVEMLHPAMEKSRLVVKKMEEKFPTVQTSGEKPRGIEELHGVKTWLAHLFVVEPAHEKLNAEKQFVPPGIAGRNLKAMQEILKKHGKSMSKVSLALTIGAGVVTGGLFGAVAALVGKTQAAAWIGGGSILGASAMGGLGQLDVMQKEKQLDASLKNALVGFKANDIRALKTMYENNSRAYQQAVKNQRMLAVGGAIAGGFAGAALSGHFDQDAMNIPDLGPTSPEPLVPEIVPEEIHEAPVEVEEGGGEAPAYPEEYEEEPPLRRFPYEPGMPEGDSKLDNFEKGDEYKNPPDDKLNNFEKGDEYKNPQQFEHHEHHHEHDHDYPVEYPKLGSYTAQLGDNYWNIAEGQTNAPQPYVFREVSAEDMQPLVDLTRDYLNAHPSIAREIGFPVAGNIDMLPEGGEVNTDLLEAVARDIAIENGFLPS